MFNLKWKKHSSALVEPVQEDEGEIVKYISEMESYRLSEFQESILGYISGFVVKKLSEKLNCGPCLSALTTEPNENNSSKPGYRLIASKQRGGLKVPSETVIKIISVCEKSFRLQIAGKEGNKIMRSKNLSLHLHTLISRCENVPSFDLGQHDLETACFTEDLHSTQLRKQVCKSYVQLRLLTYGKRYCNEVIQAGKTGKRQQLTKLIIFQNL